MHCHRSSLPSMEATPPAAPTSRGRPPTNHAPRFRSKRPQPVIVAKLNCEEQLRLPAKTHASPQRMKTPAEIQTTRRREVAARHRCRAASPTQQLRLHVAKLASTRRPDTEKLEHPPKRLQDHDEVQMRRLQQGGNNNNAAIARPQWTGFSPKDIDTRGIHDAPSRESGAQWRLCRQDFRPRPH
jgi:hypothetical protein